MKTRLTICLLIIIGLVALSYAQDIVPVPMESEPTDCGITKVSEHGMAVFPTIAVCDIQKAFDGYKKAQVLTKSLETDVGKSRQIVQQFNKQIAIKQAELDKLKKRSGAYEKAFEELATMKAEHKFYVQTETAKFNERRNVLAESGLDDIRAAVAEVANLRGLNLVLSQTGNRSSVIFADDELDITDVVVEALNGGGAE